MVITQRNLRNRVSYTTLTDTGINENQIVDIDGQPDSNYVYDAIGNLIKDNAEKIDSIKWNIW